MKFSEFTDRYAKHPIYKAPIGNDLHARSWQTEAPLRMLLNNLNAEVAEDPDKAWGQWGDYLLFDATAYGARSNLLIYHLLDALSKPNKEQ